MPWFFFKKKRKVGSVRKGSEGTHLIFMPTSKRYNCRGGKESLTPKVQKLD